jgi:hypothetical protein
MLCRVTIRPDGTRVLARKFSILNNILMVTLAFFGSSRVNEIFLELHIAYVASLFVNY